MLDIAFVEVQAGRAAVDNASERAPVTFTESRHYKVAAETVTGHYQGLFILLERILPAAIFSAGKAEGAPCSTATQATDNAAGGKMEPALRVAPEKAPICVARLSIGFTNHLSSRLNWRFFRRNRTRSNSMNRP
jgi:hypothetical protein